MSRNWVLVALLTFFACIAGCEKSDVPANRVFSINDLGHKKVGVQIGNTAEIYASEYGGDTAKIQVERFSKLSDAIDALQKGDLDAVLCDDAPAAVFASRHQSITVLNEVFKEESYAGVVAKENLGLLDSVNIALIQMRAMGVYDSIFNAFIGDNGDYHYKPQGHGTSVLRVATNAEFPPYEFHTEKGIDGIDMEIARYIADYLNRSLEIVDMEFDAVIDAVKSGKADLGLAGFSVTEERARIINFTDVYATSRIVVVVRSGKEESTLQRFKDTLFGN